MSQFKGFHHMYIGWVLLLPGFLLIWSHLWLSIGLLVISFWLMVDDIYQHIRQLSEPDYHSPIHRFYGNYLWKVRWIRQLNQWMDQLLGR